jgi:ethanolamine ammonia-lyase small subunit
MTLPDPWQALRGLTTARIALGRAGASLPTTALLEFQLAHARARDAVRHVADLDAVTRALDSAGLASLWARSAAVDRDTYLRRPDLGRRLDEASRATLQAGRVGHDVDLCLVIADGLSGKAVERHAAPLAAALAPRLVEEGWRLAPLVVVRHGRVAIGDEIGELLGAALVAVLIGERPGLSAPDSLGVYLTWSPRVGRTDAERNCVSNVRPDGLPVPLAADRLCWLLRESRRRRVSGIELKDDFEARQVSGRTSTTP